ncbi:MAG TPA: ABC transporter substrate-binding protein [Candidatus Binatia bacterium]|nr:ABC transporter substrate-binding protein [Candidatus Binatia bacterium]
MRRLLALLVILGLGMLAAPSEAETPYEINVILPVTGYAAFIAKAEMNALSVIENQVNAAGGIRGRMIKFVIKDDQSMPTNSVQLFNDILTGKPAVVLGPTLGSTCNAVAPLIKDGPVDYCFSPGIHPAAGTYMYTAGPSNIDLFTAIARYFRERGLRKVAIITSTDASGQDTDRSIDAVFATAENRSLTILDHEHARDEDLSVAAQVARIQASAPDVVIAWTSGAPFATMLRGLRDAGINVPIVASSANMLYGQMHDYANILPSELLFPGAPSFSPEQLPAGTFKTAVVRFLDAFKAQGVRPGATENQVWDPTLIILDAFRQYGFDITARQLRDYINNVHGRIGTYGTIDYRAVPQRGVGPESVIIQRWDPTNERWTAVSKPGGSPLGVRKPSAPEP